MSKIDTRVYSADEIARAAELLAASSVNYVDTSEISDPAIVSIANETTKGTLDQGDLFKLLSDETGTSQGVLRKALGYPEKDPDGVTLVFETTDYNGHIIANIRIIPDGLKAGETLPCDVFVGGIHHPVPVYLKGAVEYAKKEQRELLMFDSVGVGGSTVASTETIDYKTLAKDMGTAIKNKARSGVRYLMGHSLGSIPVRDLYIDYKRGGGERLAEVYLPIAMVPAAEEERAGLIMNPLFSLASTPGVLMGKMTPVINNSLYNAHPEEDAKSATSLTDKEHFNINLFGFAGILNEISDRALLDHLGEDDLVVVLAGDDQLMQNHNRAEWEKKGVIFLDRLDHACIAGGSYAVRSWEQLRTALNQRDDKNLPRADKVRMERRVKPSSGLTVQFNGRLDEQASALYAGGFGETALGLGTWGDLNAGAKVLFGNAFPGFSMPVSLYAELELVPLPGSRFSVPLGTEVALDVVNRDRATDFTYAGLRYNMFNIVAFSAQVGLLTLISAAPEAGIGGMFNIDLPLPR